MTLSKKISHILKEIYLGGLSFKLHREYSHCCQWFSAERANIWYFFVFKKTKALAVKAPFSGHLLEVPGCSCCFYSDCHCLSMVLNRILKIL